MKDLKLISEDVKPVIPTSNSLTVVKDKLYYYDNNNIEYSLTSDPSDAPVTSVNGETGDVVLTAEDIGAVTEDNLPTWSTISGKPAFVAEGANAAAARTALGLGTAATTASTAYATAAQGVLANTAVQPNDLGALGTKDTITVPIDITATGTASATTYLRGDGSWTTPANTTYTVITEAEFNTGTATTTRTISAVSLNRDIQKKLNDFIPNPPETGSYTLQSVDGVLSWVENV